MCGGFVMTIGLGAKGIRANLTRQLIFASGRVFTYAFLGASAGCAGLWFSTRSSQLVHAQAVLSVVAGVVLVGQGLATLGYWPKATGRFWRTGTSAGGCLAGSLAGPFFASSAWHHVFLAGLLNGLLPCGLVYGYLALASSTASLSRGLATMAAFGLGTVPVMALTGLGAVVLPIMARRRIFRVAGMCVLITGVLAVARGAQFWHAADTPTASCPACQGHPTAPNGESVGSAILRGNSTRRNDCR
jgi:sulfite exporter TauE/SafE